MDNTSTTARKPATRFTADLKKKFIQFYLNGSTVSEAAALCGVSRATIYNHEKSDPAFAAAFDETRASHLEAFRDRLLTKIVEDQSWQSAAWLAERMFPADLSKPAPRDYATAQKPIFNVLTETVGHTN